MHMTSLFIVVEQILSLPSSSVHTSLTQAQTITVSLGFHQSQSAPIGA
jgi:hypothetical protein